jgi:GTP:adenosylcobinamide-phosphate guanylyltransferase
MTNRELKIVALILQKATKINSISDLIKFTFEHTVTVTELIKKIKRKASSNCVYFGLNVFNYKKQRNFIKRNRKYIEQKIVYVLFYFHQFHLVEF